MASRTGLTLLRNARQGDAQAQLALGRVYLTGEHGLGKSHITAFHWLEMAARAGLEDAWLLIGAEIPLAALKEPATALPWYQRAAAAGVAPAQRTVGLWLLEQAALAAPGAPDVGAAIALLEQAGAQDDLAAQEMLGEILLHGRHLPKDRAAARTWLERAAAQGSARSLAHLVALCTEERDLAGIERYARPLAEQGDAHASYALGMVLLGQLPAASAAPR